MVMMVYEMLSVIDGVNEFRIQNIMVMSVESVQPAILHYGAQVASEQLVIHLY